MTATSVAALGGDGAATSSGSVGGSSSAAGRADLAGSTVNDIVTEEVARAQSDLLPVRRQFIEAANVLTKELEKQLKLLRGSLAVGRRDLLASSERKREMGAEIARLRSSAEQQGPQVAAMKGLLAEALRERDEKAVEVEKLGAVLQRERAQRETAENTAEVAGNIAATCLEQIQ